MVKNQSSNARKHQFDPQPGKIPPAMEQLSPCTTTPDACAPWSPCSAATEATTVISMDTKTKTSPNFHNQRKPTHSNKDPPQPKQEISLKSKNTTVALQHSGKRHSVSIPFVPLFQLSPQIFQVLCTSQYIFESACQCLGKKQTKSLVQM